MTSDSADCTPLAVARCLLRQDKKAEINLNLKSDILRAQAVTPPHQIKNDRDSIEFGLFPIFRQTLYRRPENLPNGFAVGGGEVGKVPIGLAPG